MGTRLLSAGRDAREAANPIIRRRSDGQGSGEEEGNEEEARQDNQGKEGGEESQEGGAVLLNQTAFRVSSDPPADLDR